MCAYILATPILVYIGLWASVGLGFGIQGTFGAAGVGRARR